MWRAFSAILFILLGGTMVLADDSCMEKLEKNLFDYLLNMMLKLKNSAKEKDDCQKIKHVPAFGASLTARKDLTPNEIVKFDKVWTNIGNGYDPKTGVFTSPRTGTYYFSSSVMNEKSLRLHLMKNEVKTVSLFPGNTIHTMGSLNMVLELKKGDRVYMQYLGEPGENSLYTEANSNFSMFSGYLLSE